MSLSFKTDGLLDTKAYAQLSGHKNTGKLQEMLQIEGLRSLLKKMMNLILYSGGMINFLRIWNHYNI